MHGLIIRNPWIEQILSGRKIWEIRGSRTNVRGTIALIRSGTGKIYGICELVDVIGPLTLSEMYESATKHCGLLDEMNEELPYPKTYAWVLNNVRAFEEPIPYKHPSGAIIWVKLPDLEIPTTKVATVEWEFPIPTQLTFSL